MRIKNIGPENFPHLVSIAPRDLTSRKNKRNPNEHDSKPIKKTPEPIGPMMSQT